MRRLIKCLTERQSLNGVRFHTDNGDAMKAATILIMFYRLGSISSFLRLLISAIIRIVNRFSKERSLLIVRMYWTNGLVG